jgi:hypothetical protein
MAAVGSRTRRWASLSVAIAFGLLLSAKTARAAPSAKLTYSRGPGAEICPDEGELRKAVAARLGYDPFFPWATKTIEASVTRGKKGFHGEVKVIDAAGMVRGARALDATSQDCTDIVRALALAISIALDDLGVDTPNVASTNVLEPLPAPSPATLPGPEKPPSPSDALAKPAPDSPAPVAAPSSPGSHSRLEPGLWVAPGVSFGTAPSTAVGLQIDVRLRYALFSADAELHADLPASGGNTADLVRTYLVVGSLVPCVHWPGPLFGCAVLSAGTFQETGINLAVPRSEGAPYLAAGARIGVEIPVFTRYFLVAHGDALGVVVRHVVQVDGHTAFSLPGLVGQLAVGGGVYF